MNFVISPNLPKNAKIVLVGKKYAEIIQENVEKMGIKLVLIPDNPALDKRVSGHADLNAIHLGGETIALAPYLKGSGVERELRSLGMEIVFPETSQSSTYPADVALNICICGNSVICNPKSADSDIVEYLTKAGGFKKIEVRQGYTKCSICVVNEKALISSDEIICSRAEAQGYDVLKIEPGHIDLPGYDYGFIGGASFKISSDVIAFTGHLDLHPNKKDILNFLSLHNIKCVYITQNPLFDIGGAIQIVEK